MFGEVGVAKFTVEPVDDILCHVLINHLICEIVVIIDGFITKEGGYDGINVFIGEVLVDGGILVREVQVFL